jgi:hypothetical protein
MGNQKRNLFKQDSDSQNKIKLGNHEIFKKYIFSSMKILSSGSKLRVYLTQGVVLIRLNSISILQGMITNLNFPKLQ